MTPAERDAIAQVQDEVAWMLRQQGHGWVIEERVEDVTRALRLLAADPGKRSAVLVALGLGGEGS